MFFILTLIYGKLGSAKTTLLTIIGYFSKKLVVSNYKLKYPNKSYEEFDIVKFLKQQYSNRTILMDEAYVYLESRLSGRHKNLLSSYVLFQSRKKDVDMYLTVQLTKTIDIRFREMVDFIIKCNGKKNNAYEFVFYRVSDGKITVKYITEKKIKQFFKFFDTNEVITDSAMIKEIQQIGKDIRQNTEKHVDKLVELYIKKNKMSYITRDMVVLYVEENELHNRNVKLIYTKLKVKYPKYVKGKK